MTAIDFKVGAVTVKAVDPLIVPEVAVMVAAPCVKVVANPVVLFTVTTEVFEEVQVAVLVKFCVVPLL